MKSKKSNRTPLHYAAADGKAVDVAKLLQAGADPNAQDENGWTPLHFAAQSVSSDIAKALLAAGAKVDTKDSRGNTPLFRAVFSSKGDGSVISLLRGAGADPNSKNESGVSPVSLSHTISNYDVAKFFSDLK